MSFYDLTIRKQDGTTQSMADYRGKILLIVNSATACGFTPQYEDLELLYKKYQDRGVVVMDFPCNQFGEQAPGTDEEIKTFCTVKYGITYPIFSKVEVNGEGADPLFVYLKAAKGFEGFRNHAHPIASGLQKMLAKNDPDYAKKADIKWNFTKFLVDRDGNVVDRYEPVEEITTIEEAIKTLL